LVLTAPASSLVAHLFLAALLAQLLLWLTPWTAGFASPPPVKPSLILPLPSPLCLESANPESIDPTALVTESTRCPSPSALHARRHAGREALTARAGGTRAQAARYRAQQRATTRAQTSL